MNRHTILVIGGTDSSGGAGLAADIRAAAAHGVDARLAVTAVTAQNEGRVGSVAIMSPALVAEQIAMALQDGQVVAVKIGMLGDESVVQAVAGALADFEGPIVLDPVIAASSGGLLLSKAGIASLIERLLPMAALVTPNLPELAILADRLGMPALPDHLGVPVFTSRRAGEPVEGRALIEAGARAVLVKGGHGEGTEAVDLLYCGSDAACAPLRLTSARLAAELRGTGCMLATAIACGLAKGLALEDACAAGKDHVRGLLARVRKVF
ncbi:hydroxymethylpyrimidine/phosphomethylpyrimidine kinase [Jiella endophytica]|uniref:hydroxymethylpyrimidine kinase n=1 Tax=Jiella endophytica TaxID=2558362 RepID=A0A4Y8RIY5_9HYPH|nr:hydroxymethylpyrimidine/phosphomethylpyrimidine kinase [Jiella endophytica]TFF23018.1 hydroxymethylpyrimidine/phosphomethylpyrimidine kinase [Jiella endophytica]